MTSEITVFSITDTASSEVRGQRGASYSARVIRSLPDLLIARDRSLASTRGAGMNGTLAGLCLVGETSPNCNPPSKRRRQISGARLCGAARARLARACPQVSSQVDPVIAAVGICLAASWKAMKKLLFCPASVSDWPRSA